MTTTNAKTTASPIMSAQKVLNVLPASAELHDGDSSEPMEQDNIKGCVFRNNADY